MLSDPRVPPLIATAALITLAINRQSQSQRRGIPRSLGFATPANSRHGSAHADTDSFKHDKRGGYSRFRAEDKQQEW